MYEIRYGHDDAGCDMYVEQRLAMWLVFIYIYILVGGGGSGGGGGGGSRSMTTVAVCVSCFGEKFLTWMQTVHIY